MGYDANSNFDIASAKTNIVAGRIPQAVTDGMRLSLDDARSNLIDELLARNIVGTGVDRGEGPRLASEASWPIIDLSSTGVILTSVHERATYLERDLQPTEGSGTMTFRNRDGELVSVTGAEMEPRDEIYSGWFNQTVDEFNAKNTAASEVQDQIDQVLDGVYK
jgi:hypothetical protein